MPPSRARKKGLRSRTHASRQGHQDRRYRLWRWSSSRRYCRQRFTCRVQACGVRSGRMLLRSTPGTAHRRQSLRLGPARPLAQRRLWHRTDRTQSEGSQTQHAGRSKPAPIQKTLESRTPLRMAAQLQKTRHPMGIPHRKLPRFRASRLPQNSTQTFMRWLLGEEPSMRCSVISGT